MIDTLAPRTVAVSTMCPWQHPLNATMTLDVPERLVCRACGAIVRVRPFVRDGKLMLTWSMERGRRSDG